MRLLIGERTRPVPAERIEQAVRDLHRAMDGYRPTELSLSPRLASVWNASTVAVKLETDRWGLPSFKVVGTAWATVQALSQHLPAGWTPQAGLAGLRGRLPDVALVAATQGNHGEALAFLAHLLGVRCRIYVSSDVAADTRARIAARGAEIVTIAGTYDDAVAASAHDAARAHTFLVSDTSWDGYEDIPRAVAHGYSTILAEVDEQLTELEVATPDLVFVPMGVGALASAVIQHYRSESGRDGPAIVGVEPDSAACVMASLAADRIVTLPGALGSELSGLNCGTPSLVAWPALRAGLRGVVAVADHETPRGAELATADQLEIGPCSSATLAAADWILAGPDSAGLRASLALPARPSVLVLATDGSRQAPPGGEGSRR
jgi:diaminopropionate ammonia-lyase